jgi:hypothetical protein
MKLQYWLPFLLILFPATASAYVPPAETIAQRWAQAYRGHPVVTITGTWRQGAVSVPFRVQKDRQGLRILENGTPTTDATSLAIWRLLLQPGELVSEWQTQQVLDTKRTGLARWKERIAWTLGASGEKQAGVQVWIDRQWHVPLVAHLPAAAGRAERIEMLGYDKTSHRIIPAEIVAIFPGDARRVYALEKVAAETR